VNDLKIYHVDSQVTLDIVQLMHHSRYPMAWLTTTWVRR
jgi:hypothetical protein